MLSIAALSFSCLLLFILSNMRNKFFFVKLSKGFYKCPVKIKEQEHYFETILIVAYYIGVEQMKACGLIVEYNPFHNGHLYHLHEAKRVSRADCMIAVMSGSFLQRGEPAMIDKFHRARAAINSGIDIVAELPYAFAVQSSDLFATGSILTLHDLGVDSICFGSESGRIDDFIEGYYLFNHHNKLFNQTVQFKLKQGHSFPEASRAAYQEIGLQQASFDLTKPNNILGFSYVKAIMDNHLPIQPLTIRRNKSGYHDETITGTIASATSIRKQLFTNGAINSDIRDAIPEQTITEMNNYRKKTTMWHQWEPYFPLLRYRVLTANEEELACIQGVDEGLEHRLKKTVKTVTSFEHWIKTIKSKRYTWTRLQRMFAHLLTNTKKTEINQLKNVSRMPYLRLLGLTETGKKYLNRNRKQLETPVITNLSRNMHSMLELEERASNAYYSILPQSVQETMRKQELQLPIMTL